MDEEDDQKRTVWCGNLSSKCTDQLIYELFLQVAPLQKINLCADKDGRKNSYAFITFKHAISVDYSINMLNGIQLFDKKIIVKQTNSNNSPVEEKPKSSKNNTFDRFDGSIKASSTPYNVKHEYRNYYEDRQYNKRYNDYSRYKDKHSYNERGRHENSNRPHPYSRDKKTKFGTGNSY